MIDRLRLLALLNVIDCSCPDCLWQKVNDIGDAIETGNAVFGADGGLYATRSGMALLRQTPMLPDAVA